MKLREIHAIILGLVGTILLVLSMYIVPFWENSSKLELLLFIVGLFMTLVAILGYRHS